MILICTNNNWVPSKVLTIIWFFVTIVLRLKSFRCFFFRRTKFLARSALISWYKIQDLYYLHSNLTSVHTANHYNFFYRLSIGMTCTTFNLHWNLSTSILLINFQIMHFAWLIWIYALLQCFMMQLISSGNVINVFFNTFTHIIKIIKASNIKHKKKILRLQLWRNVTTTKKKQNHIQSTITRLLTGQGPWVQSHKKCFLSTSFFTVYDVLV